MLTIDHSLTSFIVASFHICAEVEKHNLPVAFIENREEAQIIAGFLQVRADQLEKALCTKSTVTRGEVIVSPISSATAVNVRDAFVKGVYGRLFIWIVQKINDAIYTPSVSNSCREIPINR